MTTDRLWDVTDVADYLGLPESAVYKMTCRSTDNPIPHIKLGGRLRFRQSEIETWLDLWSVSPLGRLASTKQQAQNHR